MPQEGSVLVLGGPESRSGIQAILAHHCGERAALNERGVTVMGTEHEGAGLALLASCHRVDRPASVVTVLYAASPQAVAKVARLLFFTDGIVTCCSKMEQWLSVGSGRSPVIVRRCVSMQAIPFGKWCMIGLVLLLLGEQQGQAEDLASKARVVPAHQAERHLKNIRQLTVGRQNAEAYFSFSGTKLIFQSTNDWVKDSHAVPLKPADAGLGCYQMYVLDLDTDTVRLVSTGAGATTCGYFFPGDRRLLYSSTHASGPSCPPKPKREGAYRWALDDYDIYAVDMDGQALQRLTSTPGYDAEATISPDGKTIVWTSVKDGDLDLYAMNLDGSKPRRLTHEIGYDGGAFFRLTASVSSIGRRILPIRQRSTSTRTYSGRAWWSRGNLKFSS